MAITFFGIKCTFLRKPEAQKVLDYGVNNVQDWLFLLVCNIVNLKFLDMGPRNKYDKPQSWTPSGFLRNVHFIPKKVMAILKFHFACNYQCKPQLWYAISRECKVGFTCGFLLPVCLLEFFQNKYQNWKFNVHTHPPHWP